MPQVNRALMLQLGIILLVVPAQYFITQCWKPASADKQQQNVKELVRQFGNWKSKIFSKATWQQWFKDIQDSFLNYKHVAVEKAKSYTTSSASTYEVGAEVALEPSERAILKRRDMDGNFAASAVPRNPRPAHIKYRIGQVIRHKTYGYRGVIVGWDATAKAPEGWLDTMHGKNRPPPNTPYYAVLVDISYEFYEDGATVYLAQDSFSIVTADTMVSVCWLQPRKCFSPFRC